jgi:hypothetical protein
VELQPHSSLQIAAQVAVYGSVWVFSWVHWDLPFRLYPGVIGNVPRAARISIHKQADAPIAKPISHRAPLTAAGYLTLVISARNVEGFMIVQHSTENAHTVIKGKECDRRV